MEGNVYVRQKRQARDRSTPKGDPRLLLMGKGKEGGVQGVDRGWLGDLSQQRTLGRSTTMMKWPRNSPLGGPASAYTYKASSVWPAARS